MKYYIAETEWFKGNPRHNVVCRSFGKRYFEVFGGEEIIDTSIKKPYYFKIIREIKLED